MMTTKDDARLALMCHYMLEGQQRSVLVGSSVAASRGFWIDHLFNYAEGTGQRRYFIPPSAILYIENTAWQKT
jgi:hypothetical protein